MNLDSTVKIGVGILIWKDGKTLLALRKRSHGADTFQSPGGHLEYMESFEECAKREVMEECGLEIQNIRFLCVANAREFSPKHYIHIGLTADWIGGESETLEPEKTGAWDWYSPDTLPDPINFFTNLALRAMREDRSYFDGI
jgi:8-oxo-dGTP diphosphatase